MDVVNVADRTTDETSSDFKNVIFFMMTANLSITDYILTESIT